MRRVAFWLALFLCAAVLLVVPVGCGGEHDGNGNGGGDGGNGQTTQETTEG